jgi:hypothetical protein
VVDFHKEVVYQVVVQEVREVVVQEQLVDQDLVLVFQQ